MAKRQFEAIVPAEAGWVVIHVDTSAKDDIKKWSITEHLNVIGFGVRADDGYPVPITAIGPTTLCNMDDGGDKANDCYTGFFLQAPNGWITGAVPETRWPDFDSFVNQAAHVYIGMGRIEHSELVV